MAKCAQCGRQLPALSFGKKICQWCLQHEAAQRGEVAEDAIQQVMPLPWRRGGFGRPVTQAIFGINVAVFVGMVLAGVSVTEPTTQELLHWGANSARLTLSGDWWRLVTSMFLHIGIVHIALNMWCLWNLGAIAESLYGQWTFAGVYFISGISGSLASIAWHPYGVSAGASGAIFGLAGALIASYYLGEFSAPRAVIAGSLRSVVIFAGYNLVFGAMSGSTDNAAHIGGLVGGGLLGALIARVAPQRDAFFGRFAIMILGVALVVGAGSFLERSRGLEAHLSRANELLRKNHNAEGIAQLQQIIRQRPGFASAHFALAHAYFNLRQYPQAEAELKRVLELEPSNRFANNQRATFELGITYLNENRIAEAKTIFAGMVATNASDADGHYGLGIALAAEQNHLAAIDEFSTVLRIEPDSEGVYYQMGKSYLKLEKYDDAITAFQKEQQQNGDDHDIEAGLADAYRAKGMTEKAQDAERKAAQLLKSAGGGE
jgi:membrane associated rhomboid family serine protease/Tfp pilus assembly protein PilF